MAKVKNKFMKRVGGIALAFALAGVSAYLLSQSFKKEKNEKSEATNKAETESKATHNKK
jgi:hypothetical protein